MNVSFENGWRQYKNDVLHESAERLFQKRVYSDGVSKIHINVYEYDMQKIMSQHPSYVEDKFRWSYTLEIYIPEELSPTNKSIKIDNYNYNFDPDNENAFLAICEDDAATILFPLLSDSLSGANWEEHFFEVRRLQLNEPE